MKYIFIQIAFLSLVLVIGCHNKIPATSDSSEQKRVQGSNNALISIDLMALKAEQLGKPQAVVVNDQVFKTVKTYMAYDFKKLLFAYLKTDTMDVAQYEIVFVCGDGYRPTMKMEKLQKGAPYLAFRDMDAKQGNWLEHGSTQFAPYYIVWTDVPFNDHSWSMPYGLVKVEIKKADDKLIPKDSSVMMGYTLFRDRCNRCHQINGIGGDMGTELNYPKSVTEYWKEADLKAFIKQPKSYRQNAKMPDMGSTDAEITAIVDYLKYMAQHKTGEK